MKKRIRSILSLMLIAAMCVALTACGMGQGDYIREGYEDSTYYYEEEPVYVEVAVGDVLYSDDYCTVTLASLETNDKGGSTLTLSVVNNYETSLCFDVGAYKTNKVETYVEKVEAGKNASLSTTEVGDTLFTLEGNDVDDVEFEANFDFSKEYIYFNVSIGKYSVYLTEDQIDSAEYADYYDKGLYPSTIIKVSTYE